MKISSLIIVVRRRQHLQGPNAIKNLHLEFANVRNKLECFSFASLSRVVLNLWVRSAAYPKEEYMKGASFS
jgi:hypothetical protein